MKKYLIMIRNIVFYFLIYFVMQLVFGVLLGIGYSIAYGSNVSPDKLQEIITQNTYIALIGAAVASILIYIVLLKNKIENFAERCRFKKIKFKDGICTIVLALSLGALSVSFIFLTQNTFKNYQDVSKNLAANLNSIPGIIAMIVLIPIFEEILFRGLIFNELKMNINIIISVILQAAIFALAHGNIAQGIYTFVVGVTASLVYLWTRSIISNMLLHVTFNLSGTFIFPILLYYTEKYVVLYIGLGIIFLFISAAMLYRNKYNRFGSDYMFGE